MKDDRDEKTTTDLAEDQIAEIGLVAGQGREKGS